VLDAFAEKKPAEYRLAVTGAPADLDTQMRFDPAEYAEGVLPELHRPKFLAIISSNALATTMLRRASGRVDGLIIESAAAGGHNAPPRGKMQLTPDGQPIYGVRDQVDLADLRTLGVPFWLAGMRGTAEGLREALAEGAEGVQIGTAFALSEESGLRPDLKHELLAQAASGSAKVFTHPLASPTGFPFKVALLEGTSSQCDVYDARERVCDLGYLREAYVMPDNRIGYRCAAEPVGIYVAKGGKAEDSFSRRCMCNALLANIGHAQIRSDGEIEPALVTVGDGVNEAAQFLRPGAASYSAAEVIEQLLVPVSKS
jgi:nitronate monooxygenase